LDRRYSRCLTKRLTRRQSQRASRVAHLKRQQKMKAVALVSVAFLIAGTFVAVRLRDSRADVEALRRSLVDAQARIDRLQLDLSAAAARVAAWEQSEASQRSAPQALPLPLLESGSDSRESDAVIYGPDARLRVAPDVVASSPAGVMVADEKQQFVVGELRLENATSVADASGAKLDIENHRVVAQSVALRPRRPNQTPESAAMSVAPAAAQEPSQP